MLAIIRRLKVYNFSEGFRSQPRRVDKGTGSRVYAGPSFADLGRGFPVFYPQRDL